MQQDKWGEVGGKGETFPAPHEGNGNKHSFPDFLKHKLSKTTTLIQHI
jgi:hypothetical protein